MKLIFITRKFPPSTGGMERHAYDLYTNLATMADVTLLKWGGSNKYLPVVLPYLFLRACVRLLRGDIEVIYVQDGVLAPLGYVLSRLFGRPYVLTVHGKDITFKNALFQKVNINCISKAAAVISVSQATADEALKRGISKDQLHVIPNGIEDTIHGDRITATRQLHERLGVTPGMPLLVTVGRLVERKGVAWFIDAVMPQLVKKYPKLQYLVVGEGVHRDIIKAQIASHKLDAHVRLLGRVDDEYRKIIYNGANIFVQPNILVPGDIEGFGLVLLEASLCELPVVATGIEGIRDAITDGENGVLIKTPSDAAAFTAAVVALLDSHKRATDFGRASRTYTLKHYNWQVLAERYLQVFASTRR